MTDTALDDGPAIVRDAVVPIFTSSPGSFTQATAGTISGDRSAILAASIDTAGIAHNMAATDPAAQNGGGGNLNGSANAALKLGQAGTSGQRIAVPRASAGNFTGVV